MNKPSEPVDIAVIGAGIIGVCAALELAERGLRVTIFDPAEICSKTSYGNAGVISPWTCVPQSMPGLWKHIPGWIMRPDGPISIRPAYMPKFLPWAMKFFAAAQPERLNPVADALFTLSRGSVDAYRKRLDGTGEEHLVRDSLYVHVYKSPAAASLDHLGWQMRRQRQVPVELIDKQSLRRLEPELADDFQAAIIIKQQGRARDPAGIGIALAKKALALGATHIRTAVTSIKPNMGQGCIIETETGQFRAHKIVLAAGVWSGHLLQTYGYHLPLEAERGYHLLLKQPGIELNNSVMDAEGKYVASSMAGGIRIAGTAEFSGLQTPPNYVRARRFAKQAKRLFPRINCEQPEEWMGSRPSFPDSLPCLGNIPDLPGIIAAFGHSHYGLGMAPATSEIIADCVTGKTPNADMRAYSIGRFT
jgi:D-amino-acid dehydrogenase